MRSRFLYFIFLLNTVFGIRSQVLNEFSPATFIHFYSEGDSCNNQTINYKNYVARSSPDPSLSLLIDVLSNESKATSWGKIWSYDPIWSKSWGIPENYIFPRGLSQNDTCIAIIYNAYNHKFNIPTPYGEPQKEIIFENIKIQTTNHGIVINKDEQYSWCFIADGRLFSSIEKLRWSTFGKDFWLFDGSDILVFQQVILPAPVYNIVAINYKEGIIYCINDLVASSVSLEDESLLILDESGKQKLVPLNSSGM